MSSVKALSHWFSLSVVQWQNAGMLIFFYPPPSICCAGWSSPALIMWALLYLVLGDGRPSAVFACACVFVHAGVHSLGGVAHWSARLRSPSQNTNKGLARSGRAHQLLFQPQNKSLSRQLPLFLRLILEEDLRKFAVPEHRLKSFLAWFVFPSQPLFLFLTSSNALEGQSAISGWT